MLIVINQYCDLNELAALLDGQAETATIICCADGVYLTEHIIKSWPLLSCYALTDDCTSRGITASQTMSFSEWVALSLQHQQWVAL